MIQDDPVVCYCGNVRRSEILRAITQGARSLEEIQRATGAGTGSRCQELNPKGHCCHGDILAILRDAVGSRGSSGGCCGRRDKS
jgi:NAD(P)H-nitrite reductase large subunit